MKKKLLANSSLIFSLTLSIQYVSADENKFEYQLSENIFYDDNYLFDRQKLSSFGLITNPKIIFSNKSASEELNISLQASIKKLDSLKEYNTTDKFLNANKLYLYKRDSLTFNLDYSKTDLRNSVNEDIVDLVKKNELESKALDIRNEFNLTKSDTLIAEYNINKRNFSSESSSNSLTQNLNFQIFHQIDLTKSVGVQSTFTKMNVYGSDNVEYGTIGLLYNQSFANNLKIDAFYGENIKTSSQSEDENVDGNVYSIQLEQQFKKSSYSLKVSESTSPSSDGIMNKNKSYSVSSNYKLSELDSVGLEVNWSDIQNNNRKQNLISISPFYRKTIYRDTYLNFSYRYREKDNGVNSGIKSNYLNLGLMVSF